MTDRSPVPRPAQVWADAMRGGGYPAIAAGAVVAVAAIPAGAQAVTGAVLGLLLTLGVFVVGPLIGFASSRWSPPAVMAAALAAYGTTVSVLGLAFLVFATADWLNPVFVGVAIFVTSTAWMAGHIRATGRARVLLYGAGPQADAEADVAGHDGSDRS